MFPIEFPYEKSDIEDLYTYSDDALWYFKDHPYIKIYAKFVEERARKRKRRQTIEALGHIKIDKFRESHSTIYRTFRSLRLLQYVRRKPKTEADKILALLAGGDVTDPTVYEMLDFIVSVDMKINKCNFS